MLSYAKYVDPKVCFWVWYVCCNFNADTRLQLMSIYFKPMRWSLQLIIIPYNYRKISNIRSPNHNTYMFLVSSWSCLYPLHWSQVLNPEWRCSWSSAVFERKQIIRSGIYLYPLQRKNLWQELISHATLSDSNGGLPSWQTPNNRIIYFYILLCQPYATHYWTHTSCKVKYISICSMS